MRILKREPTVPIHLCRGDTIVLSYDDGNTERELLRHSPEKSMTINEAAVFELDKDELAELGLRDSVGGLLGERA